MTRKPNGYWTMENTLKECRQIINKMDYLPNGTELNIMDRGDLSMAINRNGGFYKIRKMLNLRELKKPDNYWTKENILNEARKVIQEKGYLPAYHELAKIGKNDLGMAIKKNFGYAPLRKLLGVKEKKMPNGYWTLEKTLEESKRVLKEKGYLPTADELKKIGRSNLGFGISQNGGYPKIRKMLNLRELKKPNNYWTKENILIECRKIIQEKGYLPSSYEFEKEGKNDLAIAIARKIGYRKIRKMLELPPKKSSLEQQLDDYGGKDDKDNEEGMGGILVPIKRGPDKSGSASKKLGEENNAYGGK